MNHERPFTVSRFRNRNDVFSFRVEGHLNGVRIRRNFKIQEDAAAEKSVLEIKALQMHSNLRAVATCLTVDQVREAEAAFRRLANGSRSLSFCVDFALANHRERASETRLDEAIGAYLAVKTRECDQKLISESHLTTIQRNMKALARHFAGSIVFDLTAAKLTPYIQQGNGCLKTYNNRRGLVSTFLRFAEQQEWLTDNPVKKIPHYRIVHRRGSAQTLAELSCGNCNGGSARWWLVAN
jgi:hypothetical protein